MSTTHPSLFTFFLHHLYLTDSSTAFVAPITRDEPTNLYTIVVALKTPLQSAALLLDLGGTYTWTVCTPGSYTSTTHHYIPCGSHLCDSIGSLTCSNCFRPSGPGCHNNSCALFPENPVVQSTILAQAVVDSVALATTDGRTVSQVDVVPDFVMACSDDSLLRGLPEAVVGLVGFGRSDGSGSPIKLLAQIYASFFQLREVLSCS